MATITSEAEPREHEAPHLIGLAGGGQADFPEIGLTALRAVEQSEETDNEAPNFEKYNVFILRSAATLSSLGLFSVRPEISNVNSMGLNVIGNDYFDRLQGVEDPYYFTDQSKDGVVLCLLGIIGGSAAHKINEEDVLPEEPDHNAILDALRDEAKRLVFDLRDGPVQQVKQEISAYLRTLSSRELVIYKNREMLSKIIAVSPVTTPEEIERGLCSRLDRSRRLQEVAYQLESSHADA
jgi:hypothetical protein